MGDPIVGIAIGVASAFLGALLARRFGPGRRGVPDADGRAGAVPTPAPVPALDAPEERVRLAAEAARLRDLAATLDTREVELRRRLDEAAGPDAGLVRDRALAVLDAELASERARRVARAAEAAREEADARARAIVCTAIQRVAVSHVAEKAVSVVGIPDELKGRLIGKEGRNVRALERATGCDVLVDDTPGVVTISGFDPVRREIARRAVAALVADGRVHPERIEEAVATATRETEADLLERGRRALADADVGDAHPRVVALLGRLAVRTSYGQNVLAHSVEVAHLAGVLAAEVGLDPRIARRIGLFHDLGKAIDHEREGAHAVLGGELLAGAGESPVVVNGVASHHEDVAQETLYGLVVQSADAVSAARPGARSDGAERQARRLADLERIATSFDGVTEAYAVRAGRELRVAVEAGRVSDEAAVLLAREIARAIEAELSFPGEIRVTVLRETKAVDVAR